MASIENVVVGLAVIFGRLRLKRPSLLGDLLHWVHSLSMAWSGMANNNTKIRPYAKMKISDLYKHK